MNILKKIFSRLFKLSLIIIGISLIVWGITAINDYYSSDEYKYKAVIGKTFPIINELSSLIDIGNSSLKVLENGDISIKFRMSPIEERLFKSASGNEVFFSLRDKDGFEIDSFSLDTFTRSRDDNDEVFRLSYTSAFERSRYGSLSTMQKSLIHTDRIFLDSFKGLETLEPYEVRQAALEEESKIQKSSDISDRDKLYNDNEKFLSQFRNSPSLIVHREMSFKDKIVYENKFITKIEVGMNYKDMVKAMGSITPRKYWRSKYFSVAKESRKAYRYGDYIVYFYKEFVEAISYEKL